MTADKMTLCMGKMMYSCIQRDYRIIGLFNMAASDNQLVLSY